MYRPVCFPRPGNTWSQEGLVTPDRNGFQFTAKDDGPYWFTIVIEDLQGHKDISDVTKTPPDKKIIIKTTKPRIVVTNANRNAETIVIEWQIDDKYPNENLSQVHFKPVNAPDSAWKEVTLPATSKTGVRFFCSTLEPVVVRVTGYDLAKNKTEVFQQFEVGIRTAPVSSGVVASPAQGGSVAPAAPPTPLVTPVSSVGTSPVNVTPAVTPAPTPSYPANPPSPPSPSVGPPVDPQAPSRLRRQRASGRRPFQLANRIVPPAPSATTPTMPSPNLGTTSVLKQPAASVPPAAPPAPAPGTSTGSSLLLNPAATPVPPVVPSSPGVQIATPGITTSGLPPAVDPQPAPVSLAGNGGTPTPVPVWTGPQTPPPPAPEPPHIAVINYLAFDLAYEVETHGPSGIDRVILWVTRDDGRTWVKWSQHDGKNQSIHVNLNVPANPQPEGPYGFRVVPVSGAGLSEREPVPGDAPDLRVVVDVTPPSLDIFPPVGDANNPDILVIRWRASDRNFTDDPITIEWAEKPTGPWQAVALGGEVVQTVAGTAPVLRRLPNVGGIAPSTGQYAWRVPAGLPPRVYLKVCRGTRRATSAK